MFPRNLDRNMEEESGIKSNHAHLLIPKYIRSQREKLLGANYIFLVAIQIRFNGLSYKEWKPTFVLS